MAVALGVYAKGPVILIHLLPVALSMPLRAGRDRPSARQWAGGLTLALAVALVAVGLWLVPALILGGPEYRIEVPWRQSGGRMVASFAHRKPWWFYASLLPAMIWPFGWTGAGLGALRPRQLWADPGTRLAVVWAMGAFLRLRARVTAFAALPLALMIGLHLGLSPLLSACYDMTDLGRAVTPHDAAGIAVTDGTYHVQLNFSGRQLNPVARLSDDAVAGWLRDHPGGVLLDQTDRPLPGITPVRPLPFCDRTYTLHRSQKVAP
ncbi:hypothetical protein [Paracoccus sp. S4493]|uniref:hypothetical protein n=1 Tax=Paracoccus sp. S4493 TaxID=579490 RepID=UPI00069669FB|nr:hypothetical protein [Paracoccus sp. S4493]